MCIEGACQNHCETEHSAVAALKKKHGPLETQTPAHAILEESTTGTRSSVAKCCNNGCNPCIAGIQPQTSLSEN